MKKITGKALSLVLSLALVASSFSAAFAFAATKSVTGQFSADEPDEVYLVNAKDTHYGTTPTNNKVDLYSLWSPAVETKDHQHEDASPVITSISHASGDKLVKWSDLDSDAATPVASLTLRNDSVEGKETLSVLYQGSYYDDDDNEILIKTKATITVYVLDEGSVYVGEANPTAGGPVVGSSVDDDTIDDFSVTPNSEQQLGLYEATLNLSGDAQVTWAPVTVQTIDPEDASAPSTPAEYYLQVTTGGSDVHLGGDAGLISGTDDVFAAVAGRNYASATSKYVDDAKVGNVVITAKKIVNKGTTTSPVYKASTDSDDKLTLKSKVGKVIDADVAETNAGLTGTYSYIQKDSSTYLRTASGADTNELKVPSGYEVKFGTSGTYHNVTMLDSASVAKISGSVDELTVSDGSNASAIKLDNGSVTVEDAKTGDITTNNGGDVTVDGDGAKTGKISADLDSATSGAVVTVNGGTTGDIETEGTISIDALDEEVPVSVGTISADTASDAITVNSEDSKVTIGSIKATAAASEITLTGDAISVGSVDYDHYDAILTLENFDGDVKVLNSDNGSIITSNDDEDNPTTQTISGDVTFDSISIGADTTLAFTGSVKVADIDGDGTLKIGAGKLYITDSASGVTLKLSDAALTAGETVFKSDSETVDVNDLTPYGFTLVKSEGSTVDTFKIDTLEFAGLQITSSSTSVAEGESATFTATAYPGGTVIPEGATIVWDFDGSDAVFDVTSEGNVATIKVLAIDPDFASENKGTLTAKLQDEDGYDLDDYGTASVDVSAVKVPAFTSDTTSNFSIAPGASYTFKITSATQPVLTAGTPGVFSVTDVGKSGNDYFVKITAIGKVGAEAGIYVNGTKLLVASIKSGITSDTTTDITVKKGASYTYKITAPSAPTFAVGTANVLTYKLTSQSGNNYFYQITAVGAVGAKAGIYVNGEKINAVTIG